MNRYEKESLRRFGATCNDVDAILRDARVAVEKAAEEATDNAVQAIKEQVTYPFRAALAEAEEEIDGLRDELAQVKGERDSAQFDLMSARQEIAELEARLAAYEREAA